MVVIMQITMYKNYSDNNHISKTLGQPVTLTGSLRNESNVINPNIRVEVDNPSLYNYAHIPEFGRYYYITDMRSIRTNLWELSMHVDVLMSFEDAIKQLPVIVSNAENDDSRYMSGEQWATTVKRKTDVISFPSGLLETGEFILITSGGIATGQ
jgi:hypothetical protein